MDSRGRAAPDLFRARNLHRGFCVPSDRFDHLCRLFLPAFPTFLSPVSLPVFLSLSLLDPPSRPVLSQETRAHLSRTAASRISGSGTLPVDLRDPDRKIKTYVRILPCASYGREGYLSFSRPISPSLLPFLNDNRRSIVRQIYFALILAVYGNKLPRWGFDYPRGSTHDDKLHDAEPRCVHPI